jgi:hypothetical protein
MLCEGGHFLEDFVRRGIAKRCAACFVLRSMAKAVAIADQFALKPARQVTNEFDFAADAAD